MEVKMIVSSLRMKLYAPNCHSLKDKRMIVKSLINRTRNKFNVSIAEVEEQDYYQTIVIGVVCVSSSRVQANMLSLQIFYLKKDKIKAKTL
jgi:uncharacterized protein YlxP (DUF503 family)